MSREIRPDTAIAEYPYGSGTIREVFIPQEVLDARTAHLDDRGKKWIQEFHKNYTLIADIQYFTKTGKIYRFSKDLPKGYHLARFRGEMGMALEDSIRIVYGETTKWLDLSHRGKWSWSTTERFQAPGSLLRILHEMGHAHVEKTMSEERREEQYELRERFLKLRSKSEKEENLFEYLEKVLQEERNAWAYAVRKLRELRHRSIDLEPELDDDALTILVHTALASYERGLHKSHMTWRKPEDLMRKNLRPKRLLRSQDGPAEGSQT